MKTQIENQNANEVIRVPIWPMRMVNAHLIKGSKGLVLVDAGMPGSERTIEKTLRSHGMTMKDIQLIVITHAHTDHAGSAAAVREMSGAPILAHADDAKHYSGEEPMTYCATGLFGSLFLKTGLPLEPFRSFTPDILLSSDEDYDLAPYGIAGRIRHTPGHTASSISIELENDEALVGDLLASGILLGGMLRLGTPIRPPFEDDPQKVSRELQRLVDAGVTKFYMGHGGPLGAPQVRAHIKNLSELRPVGK